MDVKGQAQVAGGPILASSSDVLRLQSLQRKAAIRWEMRHKKTLEEAKRFAIETDAPVILQWLDPSNCVHRTIIKKKKKKKRSAIKMHR